MERNSQPRTLGGHEPILRHPTRSAFVEQLGRSDDSDRRVDSPESSKYPTESRPRPRSRKGDSVSDVDLPRESDLEASTLRSEGGQPVPQTVNGAAKSASPSPGSENRRWYHPISLLNLALANWFLIGIGIAIGLAARFPRVASQGGYIRSEYSIQYGALAIIFLITGLTISTEILYRQFKSYRLHLATQVTSLLIFPTIVFIILSIIRASNPSTINPYILVGLMVMGVLPTTVASNITMTRGADGNVEAATVEVVIGQILGIFLSPLFLQMYFSGSTWAYARPIAEAGKTGASGLTAIYKQVGKRLGLAIFLPAVVGQIVQNIGNAKKYIKWAVTHLHLPKVGTFMLLLIIWAAFSNQFENHAFETISGQSVALVCILNLALYLLLTLACLYVIRLPHLPRYITNPPPNAGKWQKRISRAILSWRFAKAEATAICFCAPAKGLTVGSPILSILYAGFPEDQRAIISIPIVIYQGQQVAAAQILTYLFKRWNARPDTLVPKKQVEDQDVLDEERPNTDQSGPSPTV